MDASKGFKLISMCVLGKDRLIELNKKYRILTPFQESQLDGDGYILTVGEDTTLQYLEHQNVISKEIVFTPPDCVAYLTAKSKYGRMGLSFLNAAKVHSGFCGRLALEIVNLSNDRHPITIKKDDHFMHIEFITREGAPSPYDGEYQFQYMTNNEIGTYLPILKKVIPNFDALSKIWLKKKLNHR
jgi:dCTP deaminase